MCELSLVTFAGLPLPRSQNSLLAHALSRDGSSYKGGGLPRVLGVQGVLTLLVSFPITPQLVTGPIKRGSTPSKRLHRRCLNSEAYSQLRLFIYISSRPGGGWCGIQGDVQFRFAAGFMGHVAYNSLLHIQSIPISHSLQFTLHVLSLLGLLFFASPLVPAFNGGRSPSRNFPALQQFWAHSTPIGTLLKLPPLVTGKSLTSKF
jgi:hypothetical protein